MKLTAKDIINRESGKNAVVIAHGPSLGPHIDKIKSLSRQDFTLISCNDIDTLTTINVDYWVWANSEATIAKMAGRLNRRKSVVAYAETVDLTPRDQVAKLLKVDYYPFDQRHFFGACRSRSACCRHFIPGRVTLQEEVKKYTNYHRYDTSNDTVAIPMLYLSILLGCKNIYVTGVDLDYSKGYVNGHSTRMIDWKETKLVQPRILETITCINESAKNIGVNIYCLDSGLPISSVLEQKSLP